MKKNSWRRAPYLARSKEGKCLTRRRPEERGSSGGGPVKFTLIGSLAVYLIMLSHNTTIRKKKKRVLGCTRKEKRSPPGGGRSPTKKKERFSRRKGFGGCCEGLKGDKGRATVFKERWKNENPKEGGVNLEQLWAGPDASLQKDLVVGRVQKKRRTETGPKRKGCRKPKRLGMAPEGRYRCSRGLGMQQTKNYKYKCPEDPGETKSDPGSS